MANTTIFGEITWESGGFDDKKAVNSKDLFLRLDDGTNEVRLVTQPYQYLVHKYKRDPENPKDFGRKVNCSMIHGSCPLCEAGDKAKPRWLLGVISRKNGNNVYKILDISYMVFSAIRKLAKNPKIGDPSKYDINIEVDRNGGATGYYTVQPLQREALSATDQLIKDNADLEDLKRRVTPPTPEQAQKIIDKINADGNQQGSNSRQSAPAVVKPSPKPVSMTSDDDTEADFPDYDGQA